MILLDLLNDYEYVYQSLEQCDNYFYVCNKLINNYLSSITIVTNVYSNLTTAYERHRIELINELGNAYDEVYATIEEMLNFNFPFYGAMCKLKDYKFKNTVLEKEVNVFLQYGHEVISITNEIFTKKFHGTADNALLAKLIDPLRNLIQSYCTLKKYASHFEDIDKMLYESIPERECDLGMYNSIELRSMKPLLDFNSFADDIKYLASFIGQFESIMGENLKNEKAKIYTQRIGNGSLRIVWGSLTIELTAISSIIRAISEGIRMFRMTSVEKRATKENIRTRKLENDERELAIINSQIRNIAQYTGLSPENPDDIEKMQKLCLPLIRYIYNNPVGMIGEYQYNLNNDLKLIESFYMSYEASPIKKNNDEE